MRNGLPDQMNADFLRVVEKLSLESQQTKELETLLVLTKEADDLWVEGERYPIRMINEARQKAENLLHSFRLKLQKENPRVLTAYLEIRNLDEEQRNLD